MAPSGIFRFEDLPGEIRNLIYGYALVARGPILITRHVDRAAMERESRDRLKYAYNPVRETILIHKLGATVKKNDRKRARILKFRDVHNLSLLLTNKSICNEARPLLYARNTFRFGCPKAFYDFYGFAHDAVRFLQDLEFVDLPVASKLKAPLARCAQLSRIAITIKSNWIGRWPSAPNRIAFIFAALHNLVLQCSCDNCRPSNIKQSESYHNDSCIAKSYHEQKRRLETISLQFATCSFQLEVVDPHQEIKVTCNEEDSRKMANEVNSWISKLARGAFTRNARNAELKQLG